uniref:Fe2OG dioxygenase domain-containing protein n=1 Tax=Rhizochromulina marina TaxID=1034831 RepID=A0A7S2WCH7_9STRA
MAHFGERSTAEVKMDGSASPAATMPEVCQDRSPECEKWATFERCEKEEEWEFMLQECPVSCGVCSPPGGSEAGPKPTGDCVDKHESCAYWADIGECYQNPGYMLAHCAPSCNVCPPQGMAASRAAAECVDTHQSCANWAHAGECSANPSFMMVGCAKSCNTCHVLDPDVRCRRSAKATMALLPGQLNETFTRAARDFAEYEPEVMSTDPWVIVFHKFTTEEEADAVLAAGGTQWTVSSDVGERLPNGSFASIQSTARTSSTSWCTEEDCAAHPMVQRVTKRIEDVSRIPYKNSEFLQMLQYQVGQYYVNHHDYIPGHLKMPCGPRLFTFYLYLSDVEAGGATAFKKLGLEVKPKKGRAVFWPSVLNEKPFMRDPRTYHEAMPVVSGKKYGVNAWLHMYDFKGPYRLSCTG